jgi:hypothetical protein
VVVWTWSISAVVNEVVDELRFNGVYIRATLERLS